MLGQRGLAWARARAGARPLFALAVIAAMAALLLGSLVGAVRAFESRGVMEAIDEASGDRGYLVVIFSRGPAEQHIPAIERALDVIGAGGALRPVPTDIDRVELHPVPETMSGDAAAALVSGIPRLGIEIRRLGTPEVQVVGALRSTLAPLIDGINLRRGPTSIAVGIVALLALVIVSVAATEPVRQRLAERALLRARGVSKGRLASLTLVETIPVLAFATLLGVSGAFAVTWWWSGTYTAVPLLVVIAGVLTLAGVMTAIVATLRGVDHRSTRADALAGVGALIVLAVLTGLASWQFWRASSPVISLGSGRTAIDPLIALAPALVLALFALLCVVIVRPVAALLALPASRGRRLSPAMPLRLAARRSGRHALTAGAVAFAVATISLAVVYLGTLQNLGSLPEALRVGTDVRVISVRDDADRAAILTLPDVEAAMRARVLAARGASGNFPVLAVDSAQLGAVMSDVDGLIDPAAIGEAISVAPFGIEIPASARVLEVRMQVPPGAFATYEIDGELVDEQNDPMAVMVTFTVMDASGALTQVHVKNFDRERVEFENGDYYETITNIAEERTEQVALPGAGPWRLLRVEGMQERWSSSPGELTISAFAPGEQLDLSLLRGASNVEAEGTALILHIPWEGFVGGPPSAFAVTADQPKHFPAVVSERLAASMNLKLETTLSLRLATLPITIDVQIVKIVPVIPGLLNGDGLIVDLIAPNMGGAEPPVDNEIWLSAAEPDALADAVGGAVQGVRIDVIGARSAQSAQETVIVFVLAAFGAVALAMVALLLRRSRGDAAEGELAILAVLGRGRRKAARVRAGEDVFVIIVAVLAGAAAGLAASWLVVPSIARAAYARTSAEFDVVVTADWMLLGGAVLATAALFALIAASVRSPKSLARVLREGE